MEQATPIKIKDNNIADKIAFWTLLVIIFLAPLFFVPSVYVPFQFAKVLLMYTGLAIVFLACIIARLKDGIIRIPRQYLYISLFAIPVVYAISALVSPVKSVSLIGQGYEVGTLTFIIGSTLLAFFIAYFFNTKSRIAYAYLAFIIPVPIVMIFQLIRLFGNQNILAFHVFLSQTTTLLGGWNDLGIYFGAVALFAFIGLELLELDRWLKITFTSILVVALFFMSVINFTEIWYLLGTLALVFFVYNFSFNSATKKKNEQRSVPIASLIVVIVSVIFILLNGNFYSSIPFLQKLNVQNIEVRPSWTGTYQVIKHSLATKPVFGIGPNRFTNEWLVAKPADVNSTVFWNTNFNYGIGLIPTFISTTGIIGTLSWLVFFVLFVWVGFKALFIKTDDPFIRYAVVSSFILSVYLWILSIIYVPSAALLILTVFFTGIFLATLSQIGIAKIYSLNFVKEPRLSFISVLVFIALLLGLLLTGYIVTRKFIAAIYFNKALYAGNVQGNATTAENYLLGAVSLSHDSLFYQTLTSLYLTKISNLISTPPNVSQDILQNQFRTFLANAQAAAQAGVNADQTNYQNWINLGNVYAAVVPFNITGAYDNALAAYTQAQKLSPLDPSIYLTIAKLDVSNKNPTKAEQDINQALALKNNYTDAIFYLSQIQANQGDIPSAIQSAQAAAYLNPNDSGIYLELGLLRYDTKDYADAASALEQAIAITPNYANAQYFLGISYYHLGRVQDAIKQFQAIAESNPDNKNISTILQNLQDGNDPLAGLNQSTATPPVKDSTTKSETPSTQGK